MAEEKSDSLFPSPARRNIRRECSVALEDHVTDTHIMKHIMNENINISLLKKENYSLTSDITFTIEYFDSMSDDDYNNYVDNWNDTHTVQLEKINRIYTDEYIEKLMIKELIKENHLIMTQCLKLKEDNRSGSVDMYWNNIVKNESNKLMKSSIIQYDKDLNHSTKMNIDNSSQNSMNDKTTISSSDLNNAYKKQIDAQSSSTELFPVEYFYSLSDDEYNNYIHEWNKNNKITLSEIIRKCK